VHRENAPLWREIVGHGEYALLHFAGIFRSKDHEFPVFEIEADTSCRSDIGHQVVCWKSASVINHEIRVIKGSEFVSGGSDEHRMHEECVIRSRTNHPHLNAVLRVPPSKTIEAVNAVADVEVV
jgi:hypothetical protein